MVMLASGWMWAVPLMVTCWAQPTRWTVTGSVWVK